VIAPRAVASAQIAPLLRVTATSPSPRAMSPKDKVFRREFLLLCSDNTVVVPLTEIIGDKFPIPYSFRP
jgi:hypothetical protein